MRSCTVPPSKKRTWNWLLLLLVLALLVAAALWFAPPSYGDLLEVDRLEVYQGDTLVAATDTPVHLVPTYQGSVAYGILNPDVVRRELREVYRLKWMCQGKTLSTMQVLTPESPEVLEQVSAAADEGWGLLDGVPVILYEKGEYLWFGASFYPALSALLEENDL